MKRKTLPSFNHELSFGVTRPKRRGRWLFYLVTLPVLGYGLAHLLWDELRPVAPAIVEAPLLPETPQIAAAPAPAPEPPAPIKKVDIEYVVRPNDTLGQIFERLGLHAGALPLLLDAPGVADGFRVLRPGDRLSFTLHNNMLHRLDRRINDTKVVSVRWVGSSFVAEVVETPIEIRTVQVRGTINSSLFFGGRAVGLPPEAAQQFANEIFAWDVDFARDIRPGARFKVVYEQKFRNGEYLGDGRIVAAELENDGEIYRAVRYTSPDGTLDGYFTPEARSVRRPILRTPIDFTRVVRKTGQEGREIVMHTLSEHEGVDYAAPAGTTVRAAGDGRIRFAGEAGGYGNAVIVEHGDGVSTLYAHLSTMPRDVQAGRQVKQGEIVGYVGSSGGATAPHLHYEYRVDGKHVDPRDADLPAGAPIADEHLADFQSKLGALIAALERQGDAVVTALRTD